MSEPSNVSPQMTLALVNRIRELEAELKQTKAERDALLKQIKEQAK